MISLLSVNVWDDKIKEFRVNSEPETLNKKQ